jgi:transcriptional regulator with XRE-family HTH domain
MRITKPIPGPWLRELRELAGLRQYAVEERAGLPTTAISTLERKAEVPKEVAGRIVEAIIALRCKDKEFNAKLLEAN